MRIEQTIDGHRLVAEEPDERALREAAPRLAEAYMHPFNAKMMGHDEAFDAADVIDHYDELREEGGRAFLLYEDGVLVGDADLRGIDRAARTAELAIMMLPDRAQGRGLGTHFARLVHGLAFRALELDTIYVAILPHNEGSQRLFARLGHEIDRSDAARAIVDDDDEVTLSISRARFDALNAAALEGATCLDTRAARE